MNAPGSEAGAVLYAKDMDRLASFYAAALDLAAADRDDEHVRLESPHFQLVVRQIPGPLAARIQIGDPPEPRWDAAVKLVFFVPNIEEVRAAATAHGAAAPAQDPGEETRRHDDDQDPPLTLPQAHSRPGGGTTA